MSKRQELIEKYADALRKIGMDVDTDLLTAVTIACGPSIYNSDSSSVSSSSTSELQTVQNNFCMKKLGMTDADSAMGAVQKAIETYGRSNTNKYRAVLYYIITKQQGKESVFA
ncbi:DUF2853 family protein [Pontivivens nitratireducens]|uniref:DUF2853 family protein n=1 Tax=Pontivivens nitratireducens TaxID=2758038 RepID=A0A6G7VPZ3_9RHOB|nr:DUF2853 family protein [Pontibrevibacter nitratireducens]QIK41945.1 DUF2853 family protein [Pontibrevibacter nitratireducens]